MPPRDELAESNVRYRRDLQRRVFGRALATLAAQKGDYLSAQDIAKEPHLRDAIRSLTDYTAIAQAGPIELGDTNLDTPARGFLVPLVESSIPGRVARLARPMPFNNATLGIVSTGAEWRPEGAGIPTFSTGLEPVKLLRLGIGGVVVATSEAVEFATRDDSAAAALSNALRNATQRKLDSTFASSDAAVAGVSPAGIAESATVVASNGSTAAAIAADLGKMIAVPQGAGIALTSGAWIMSSAAAALVRLLKIADANGETLAGLPIVDSSAATGVTLLIGEYLALAIADAVKIFASKDANVTIDSTTRHLFQEDLFALRAMIYSDWQIFGPRDSSGLSPAVVSLGSPTWA